MEAITYVSWSDNRPGDSSMNHPIILDDTPPGGTLVGTKNSGDVSGDMNRPILVGSSSPAREHVTQNKKAARGYHDQQITKWYESIKIFLH